MTGISVFIGQIFHSVPNSLTGGLPVDDYVAIASFVYFGVKSIKDALDSDIDDGLELELKSAEEELARVTDVLDFALQCLFQRCHNSQEGQRHPTDSWQRAGHCWTGICADSCC